MVTILKSKAIFIRLLRTGLAESAMDSSLNFDLTIDAKLTMFELVSFVNQVCREDCYHY